jgi:hypothetical protein
MAEYRTYRISSTVLRITAITVFVLGLVAGTLTYLWFAHRHIGVNDGAMMMRITTLGEPRLGERVGGLIALGSSSIASLLVWSSHVRGRPRNPRW